MQLKTTKSKNNDCGTAPGNLVLSFIRRFFDLPNVLRFGEELFLGVKLAWIEIIRGSI